MLKKLTINQVEHIAELARVGLSDEEKSKFQSDLGSILDYVDQLQKVNVKGVEPISHITGLENEMRDDETGAPADGKKFVEMAPDKQDGYVKVKKILNI